MFGWIPIIGPLIDGIVSIWKGYQTEEIVRDQGDVQVIQSANTLTAAKDSIGERLCRDLIMFPVGLNCLWVSWDNIVVYKYPDLYWKIAAYPASLSYLPYAVITYLFGATFLRFWKR